MHYRDNLPGGQNWTPIGGQGCKPFDTDRPFVAALAPSLSSEARERARAVRVQEGDPAARLLR